MDPNQITPQDPSTETKKTDIDLGKILLPKKEVVPASTVRVNAGVLLEQEQSAVLTVQGATLPVPAKPAAPQTPTPPAPPKEKATVRSIETYQGDIESLVQKNNVSVLSIASAEAARRGNEALSTEQEVDPEARSILFKKILMVAAGVLLLFGAVAALVFVFKPTASVIIKKDPPAPFINVDETRSFTVPAKLLDHASAINAFEGQREKVALSLGLIARIHLLLPAETPGEKGLPISAQQMLTMLGPNVPDTLARAIDPQEYLFGIHSFDSNQPFLILKTASYEQAFSGMLEWEYKMKQDISPLFLRTPPLRLIDRTVATSSATSTPTFVQTGFVDRIVENHDARVIENEAKDILLLWTFINRNVIVITTNEVTLREIVSRLKNAPIVPNL